MFTGLIDIREWKQRGRKDLLCPVGAWERRRGNELTTLFPGDQQACFKEAMPFFPTMTHLAISKIYPSMMAPSLISANYQPGSGSLTSRPSYLNHPVSCALFPRGQDKTGRALVPDVLGDGGWLLPCKTSASVFSVVGAGFLGYSWCSRRGRAHDCISDICMP